MLCGTLCAGGEAGPRRWLHEVLGPRPESSQAVRECRALMRRMMQQTIRDLSDPEFGFCALLPDDEEPLATRARALGQWCSGFLYGLGLGGARIHPRLSADAREVLSDLSEFARIADDVEGSPEQEDDYTQLVEYLRVGVLLVHEESAILSQEESL